MSGSPTSVAQSAAEGLRTAGVRRLFGVPGGGPNLDLIGAAASAGIPFTLMHGETASCIAAGAFGLLTGTAGAGVVTRGPGVTSAVNGLAQATLDRAPLLLLADRVPDADRERVGHQRLDQLALTRPVVRWNGVLGHTHAANTVAGAATLALGPPAGAVHLEYDPGVPGDQPPLPATPPAGGLDGVLAVARGRRRPVVVLGASATTHAVALRRVLAGVAVPVLTTYQAAGTIDSRSPDYAGLFTNGALERPLLDAADLVIGVGLDSVEPIPAPWVAPPTVLLAGEPDDAAYFGEAPVATGAPAELLAAVLGASTPDWPAGAGQQHRSSVLAALDDDGATGGGLRPTDLVRAVHQCTGDAPLTVDAGAHFLATMPFWPASRPHHLLISNGLSTMGYALPAAIGAALARPDQRVVCITGDGGLGMALAELETLARLALPVTVVVFNDAALSLIALKQRPEQGGDAAVRYAAVDFAATAHAAGVAAAVADDASGVKEALGAVEAGPFLLDARVDPASYRHLLAVSRG